MASQLRPEILEHYQAVPESERLEFGPSQLEFVRTQEIIGRHLADRPRVILDVGGGAGAYALWLAGLGHEVHLIDPVAKHVEQARARSAAAPRPIASCRVGDARALEHANQSVDVVLLFGPLYHLVDRDERRQALQEARRVLIPGGILLGAAISRFASALDGLARDLLADPAFAPIVDQDLATGIHQNPTSKIDYFTTAYFHRPEELEQEIREAGFLVQEVVGLEGAGWLLPDFEQRWRDPRRREDLIRIAKALGSEPAIRGLSAHLLTVARRPDS
jgi:ubiquinone/menaquinone biosynthesis C-methylase UbiE